jgi:hypothetical protein
MLQKVNKGKQIAIQMGVVNILIITTFSVIIETKKMSQKLEKKR